MTFTLFVINDAPYGSERVCSAVDGARRGTLAQLAALTAEADRVLVL